jgi:hypothetical protein
MLAFARAAIAVVLSTLAIGFGSSNAFAADADPLLASHAVSAPGSPVSATSAGLAALTAWSWVAPVATPPLAPPVVSTPSSGRAEAPGAKTLRVALYASFAALQALDTHSTFQAMQAGASEANPFMAGLVQSPAGFVALKAGTTAATILLAEKLAKRSPVASVLVMTAINSVYVTVVAHNYRVAQRR